MNLLGCADVQHFDIAFFPEALCCVIVFNSQCTMDLISCVGGGGGKGGNWEYLE